MYSTVMPVSQNKTINLAYSNGKYDSVNVRHSRSEVERTYTFPPLSVGIPNKDSVVKSTTDYRGEETILKFISNNLLVNQQEITYNPEKRVITFIENTKLAKVGITERKDVERYLVKLRNDYRYNPFKIFELLKGVHHTLRNTFKFMGNFTIEMGHFLDNEEPNLEGLSIVVKVPTDDPHILSDIWENLNEHMDIETPGAENIFFVVRPVV